MFFSYLSKLFKPHPIFEVGTVVGYFSGSYPVYGIILGANDFEKQSAPLTPAERSDFDKGRLVCLLESSGSHTLMPVLRLAIVDDPLKAIEQMRSDMQGASGFGMIRMKENTEFLEQTILNELMKY